MARRVEVSEPTVRRIVDTGSKQRRIEPQRVAEALGAEGTSVVLPAVQGPFTLFAIREALVNAIQSPRGRPAIKGATRRQKIPLREEEWNQLCQLAESLRKAGVKTTAGQLASILLHKALQQLDEYRKQQLQEAASTQDLLHRLHGRLEAEREGGREQPLLRLVVELHSKREVSVPDEVTR